MVTRMPMLEGYLFDPADPRAPTEEVWARMTPAERDAVEAMLPSEFGIEAMPAEGDMHSRAMATTRFTLEAFFRRRGHKIYVSSNLPVYYPNEKVFAPDVLAVRDVEPHDRERWLVSAERRGLDFVLEIHVSGDRTKDTRRNLERYARLGIPEYFFFDRKRRMIRAYRLPRAEQEKARPTYEPILPQQGRYASEVLGLDLMLEGDRLRFMLDGAAVPESEELIVKLGRALDDALAAKEEEEQRADEAIAAEAARDEERRRAEIALAAAEAARDEERRRAEEERRRAEEERRRAEEAERALAEARAEIERLRRGG